MKALMTVMDKNAGFRVYEVEVATQSEFKVVNLILGWQVKGADTQVSHRSMAKRLGIGRSTVSNAIKSLIGSGVIATSPGFLPRKRTKAYRVIDIDNFT